MLTIDNCYCIMMIMMLCNLIINVYLQWSWLYYFSVVPFSDNHDNSIPTAQIIQKVNWSAQRLCQSGVCLWELFGLVEIVEHIASQPETRLLAPHGQTPGTKCFKHSHLAIKNHCWFVHHHQILLSCAELLI